MIMYYQLKFKLILGKDYGQYFVSFIFINIVYIIVYNICICYLLNYEDEENRKLVF